MFQIKELRKMRQIIDTYSPADDKEAMEIRAKCSDLIMIQKTWNSKEHISCKIID